MSVQTLFLDRDGVINVRLPGAYVQRPEDFRFEPGSLEAIARFSKMFDRIIVVTNQQGIGKGLMTATDLEEVHRFMRAEITKAGGRIDAIYYCPDLANDPASLRKPHPNMALEAKRSFPEINFNRATIVGDSISDMLFGKRLGMKTVLIRTNPEEVRRASLLTVDKQYASLLEFAGALKENR